MSKNIECFTELPGAPQAVGPYSIAVKTGNLFFISGQIGLDPEVKKLVTGGIEAETRQVLSNLKKILQGLGLDFSDVVRTGIFLTDMSHFQTVNSLYAEAIESHRPARATMAVAGLPLGAAVEIEMIAQGS